MAQLELQQKPPIGKAAFPVTNEAFKVRAEIDLEQFYERIRSETLRLMNELGQQGIKGPELAERIGAELNNLSDVPIEQMGRKSTAEAFNLGRNLAAQDHKSEIREAVRTEVLDENTCQACRLLDGTVVKVNSDEYFEFMPPRLCHGRDFCRGFYLYRSV